MRRWLVLIVLFAFLIIPSGARAQGETKLESININLWSEYDQPSMLVIYEFTVSQDTPLPAEITLRFPKDTNLYAVAERKDRWINKDLAAGPVEVEGGIWQSVTIHAESYEPHRIEYYQPLALDGNKRYFKFHWFGDYYVEAFTVSVRVPPDSTSLVTSPALDNSGLEPDGAFIYGTMTKSHLRTMNSMKFELEYQRTETTLIDPNESTGLVQPVAPVNEDTPGRVSIANLPWIIGGFGVALIGIALFSYWRSTQSTDSQPRKRRPPQAEKAADAEQAYCHECGARAHGGDRFCRTCGSRLRVE
jgi:hypothetical protein